MNGKVAVVTGAANGIGRACAVTSARRGAQLALFDLEGDALQEVAEELRSDGATVLAARVDCTSEEEVARGFRDAVRELGPVQVLVNNVGQSAREKASEFFESEPATWRRVIEVSLVSTMLCSRQVVPAMRERRSGKIINMSSDAALIGDSGLADYVAAKSGVLGFTRALARELAPFQVNVNAVLPGTIATRAHERMKPEVLERIKAGVPMGYIAEPGDVANLVAFLAGEESRYITGQSILVDGGRWMH